MSDLIGRRKLLPPVQQALASGMVRILDLSRDLGDVDIQIIGWEPHASTGLGGWIGLKNKAFRERSNLPHHSSTTLADLFKLHFRADPFSAVRASAR
jgi:hypothetical protein